MQYKKDEGQEWIQDRRDAGKKKALREGCTKGGIQNRRDT